MELYARLTSGFYPNLFNIDPIRIDSAKGISIAYSYEAPAVAPGSAFRAVRVRLSPL